jgi:guanylate kinase
VKQHRPLVIVLHGPSGAGKDSVIDLLRQRTGIHRATSSTSREPRDDERDGNHYHFLSEEEFREKIEHGDFAEWALVYGDYKGLERSELEGPLSKGEDVIIRTDVQGAKTWRQKLEGAIFIFLLADDDEALQDRLKKRGSESQASFNRRVAALGTELADIENNDYVVRNRKDRLDEAAEELERIIELERQNPKRPAARLLS